MRVCILQPSYIPWKGFFDQIRKSDVFVFFDTVQYDKRGWRNRNKIKTPHGVNWLTIPVHAKGSHAGLLIKDVEVQDRSWAEAHLQTLRHSYRKAPCFDAEFPWIETMLLDAARNHTHISKIDAEITETIARYLGITATRFVFASDLPVDVDDPSRRLMEIVRHLGGDVYLSGPSAKSYLDTAMFESAGITVEWMSYNYPETPQLYPPFTHEVSILDLILNVGSTEAGSYIWKPLATKGNPA